MAKQTASFKATMAKQRATLMQMLMKKYSSMGKKQEVPKGHFVVYVGESKSRFIVPISCLTYYQFQDLLEKAEEEYGFNFDMGLTLPCQEDHFLSIISIIG